MRVVHFGDGLMRFSQFLDGCNDLNVACGSSLQSSDCARVKMSGEHRTHRLVSPGQKIDAILPVMSARTTSDKGIDRYLSAG